MIARRALIAGGGSSFVVPTAPGAFGITDPPQGGWPGRGSAVHFNGYTYIAFANDAGGQRIAIFDHATGTVTDRQLTADGSTPVDHHNSPAIEIRQSDGRLVTARCDHDGPQMYIVASSVSLLTDPLIAGGWGTTYSIDAQLSSPSYTYPWLAEIDDVMYLTWRSIFSGTERYGLAHSSDASNATWSTEVVMFSGANVSARFWSDGTRIDIAAAPGGTNSSSYHMYYDPVGDDFYLTDGTLITDPVPIAFSNMTKIFDGAAEGMESSTVDIKKNGSEIAVALNVDDGSDNEYWRSFYSGSWSNSTITTGAGPNTVYYETGFVAIDPSDLDHVIVSKRPTPSLLVERYLYDYVYSGSWSSTDVWVTGTDGNLYPAFVKGYQPELEYVWLQGTTGIGEVFDWGIMGWGVPV